MSEKFERLAQEHGRFQAPFICKIKFYAPTSKNQAKNAAHINYIGTRPGAELDRSSQENENDEYEMIDVELNNSEPGTPGGHVKYVDERPGSHGLFSSLGEKPGLKEIQKELEQHKGVVWRIVLSLTEEDAKRLDLADRKSWEDALRASVPEAAQKMGIGETNLRWVGAFHQEKGHPHVHLVLWEKVPQRRKGTLSKGERIDVKKTFMKEVYGQEQTQLYQEKTAMRDLIRDISKDNLVSTVDILREIRKLQSEIKLENESIGAAKTPIPPKLYPEDQRAIVNRIQELGMIMPDKGRIAFKYMPENVKETVTNTTKWILQQPSFQESVNRYYNAVEGMTRQYTFKENDIQRAKEKAMNDLEKRVSQLVLRAAAESKKDVFLTVDPDKAKIVIEQFAKAIGKPEDVQAHIVISKSVETLRNFGISPAGQARIINEWQAKADLKLQREDIQGIISKVNEEPANTEKPTESEIATVANILKLSGVDDKNARLVFQNVGIEEEKINTILAVSEEVLKESESTFLTQKDWTEFTSNAGIKAEYPWEPEEVNIIIPEERDKVIEAFRSGKMDPEEQADAGYTAFCMTVALKQLNVPSNERSIIMGSFAAQNNISDIGQILRKIEAAETKFLKKETWEAITRNLHVELPYPWITEERIVLDKEKYNEALRQMQLTTTKIDSLEKVISTAEMYATFLKNETSEVSKIRHEISEWLGRTNNMDGNVLDRLDLFQKRADDIQVMSRQMGVRDTVQDTVNKFAKVMFAAGLNHEQVTAMVNDWNARTGMNLDDKRLEKIISTVERQVSDMKAWGRDPVLGKKEFKDLCDTLKVDAPWMWKGDGYGKSFMQQGGIGSIAKSFWKALWRSIEQDRMESEARAEMQKRQFQRQMQRQKEKENEQ
ncbi:MobP3 family relaxase [Neobacillus pocheonensis]|uniref:MobP3 family relaxase n=1 Tax=Neobacillus pocheonensis TaxID=363869 RepID=UPI003D2C9C3E